MPQKKDLPVKVSDDHPSSHVLGVQLLASEDLQYEKKKRLQQQELNLRWSTEGAEACKCGCFVPNVKSAVQQGQS